MCFEKNLQGSRYVRKSVIVYEVLVNTAGGRASAENRNQY